MKTLFNTLPRKNFLTTLLILFSIASHAQQYKDNWYFGYHAAVENFSTTPTSVSGSSINAFNHATSMSDASGNLLFYSDAESIWSSTNTAVTGLVGGYLKGDENTSQGISFQNPADQSQYYYFYLAIDSITEGKSVKNSLYYSIIETSSAPTLTLTAEDVEVFCSGCTGDEFSEALTAIPHCNGLDYWVIVHGDEELIVYLVNALGVTENGVYNFGLEAQRGNLKASPDGTRLALAIDHPAGNVTLYDFNTISGVISNYLELSPDGRSGISFSPSSDVLYASNNDDSELEAYDLTLTTPAFDNAVSVSGDYFNMQLANNGKIYINTDGLGATMAVITAPDNISSFGLNETGLTILYGGTQHAIPNFVDAERPSVITAATISGGGNLCDSGSVEVTVTLTGSSPWDIVYNDGMNNITITGITSSPYVINASSAGTYTLVSVTGAGCPGYVSGSAVVTDSGCACGVTLGSTTWNPGYALAPGFYDGGGYITVNGTVTLTDVILTMSVGGIISVSSGAILTLDHSHIYACGDMWSGIIVEPGGTLNIINGTLIEDAELAVYIGTPNSSTTLFVDNAIFNRNMDAIFIDTYLYNTGSPTYPNFKVQNTVFTCRTIPYSSIWPTVSALQTLTNNGTLDEHYTVGGYATTTLKSPNSSSISNSGITLLTVGTSIGTTYYEMLIDGNNGSNTFNLFDNLLYGINANSSNFTCHNNVFQYIIEETSLLDGMAINATDFGVGYTTDNRIRITDDGVGGTNYFYDCTTGINLDNYRDITITRTDMRSTQMTPSVPLHGKGGMYINTPNCTQITVDSNTITNLRKGIEFTADAVAYGGVSNRQNIGPVNITNNTIRANYSGVTLTNEYAQVGIIANNLITYTDYVLTWDFPQNINVSDNHLYDVYIGVSMSGWRYWMFTVDIGWGNRAIAQDNYIKLREQTYPTSGIPQVGVYHTANFGNYIINNNVQGFGINSSVWAGIYSAGNAAYQAVPQVNCNLTEDIALGIYFNTQGRTNFKNNTMHSNGLGFVLDNAAIEQQGDSTNASDNKWTGSYPSGTFTTYTAGGSDPNNSVLYVRSSAVPYDPEVVGACGTGWTPIIPYTYASSNGIELSTDSSGLACDALPTARLSGDSSDEDNLFNNTTGMERMERLVTENAMEYGIFPDEQYINAQHRVYRWLNILPQLKDSSAILTDFYSQKQNSNIAELAAVEHTLALGRLDNAEALLSSISPNNNIEANYKKYYTAYLHYKTRSCTNVDSLALWQLVNGCAARDGEIIHQARSLYNILYQDGYRIFFDDCPTVRDEKTNRLLNNVVNLSDDVRKIKVYPNPSNGIINIEFLDNTMLNTSLTIEDVSGKIVYNNANLQLNGNIEQLNIKVEDGIYFVKVKDNITGKITVEKIVISNR